MEGTADVARGVAGKLGAAAMPALPLAAPRLASLTRLRLGLIGWVLLYHLELLLRAVGDWPLLGPVLMRGYLGVDGFFLLSGFALWLGYGHRPPRGIGGWAGFQLRRLAKIWPLHILALLLLVGVVVLAMAAGLRVNDPGRFGLRDFVLQFFLVHAWETTDRLAWNYPSWALSAVLAGYLAFPPLALALRRLSRPMLAGLGLFLAAGLCLLGTREPQIGLNWTWHLGLLRFFLEFSLGLVLARLATEGALPAALSWLALAGLPLGLALGNDPLTVLGLAGLILLLWRSEAARPAPSPPHDLAWRLGEASFSVYLCWIFVEIGIVLLLRRTELAEPLRAVLILAGFALNLALGWLAWRWIEVPANRLVLRGAGLQR